MEVSKLSGGQATGPVSETWTIAPASFKGVIYYNTYLSKLTNTGAVMRVRPNKDADAFIGGCTVCHSVSANGNVIAGGINWGDGNPLDSGSFDVAADGTQTPRYTEDDGRKMAFGALTPNGDMLLSSNGVPGTGSPIRGLTGPYPSRLYDTKTGAQISAPSLESVITNALTPAFSPDGKHVAFNFWDQCCNGFCRPTGETDPQGNPVTACVPPPGGCSKIDEACTTAADCCDTSAQCINGRCALAPPQ